MKFPTSPRSLVALSTMLPLALANFDIYYTEFTGKGDRINSKQQGYMLFNDDPTDCAPINNSPFIPWKEDFNGVDKFAVTCDFVENGETVFCGNSASLSPFSESFDVHSCTNEGRRANTKRLAAV
jgi:hypothetical protein